jgi:deazaflavin-dependent oxidoreductase (nitroreductase family)
LAAFIAPCIDSPAARSAHGSSTCRFILLTTTGRKSGKPRTQPLTYARTAEGYGDRVQGGAAQHPYWYLNLRANPLAEVRIGRDTQQVRAREAEGDERERLWRELADVHSGYDRYALKTSRRIPVIVLEGRTT